MAVRSERLAAAAVTVAAGQTVLYTVPAGKTTILKEIMCSSPVGTVSRVVVDVQSGPSGPAVSVLDRNLGTGTAGANLWTVLAAGDRIRCITFGAQTNVWLSGAELAGVSS